MQIAYIFCYTLAYFPYLYYVGVPIENKPAPGDHEFNLKLCRSNVSIECHYVEVKRCLKFRKNCMNNVQKANIRDVKV